MGEDQTTTQKLLSSLTRHSNAGAVLILGLGCENNNLSVFKNFLDLSDERLMFLNTQDVEDELEAGYGIIDTLLNLANQARRESVPLSKLRIDLSAAVQTVCQA